MKKRKTYQISVIDKTYSKIISDETKFYTSDTALELGFELKETEYNFESAEIVLLNIDDRSLVTRPVSKVLGSFAYELEDDITAHFGDWRGQLRFEQDGEVYVSSPVKFRIENDLSNERPPQLSDVQSWVSLKRYADDLIDELKQAVLSVEGVEDTFNTNELERQNQFDSAEQLRQATFEIAESERDRTFESNETTRQAQELEREKAEAQRQTVFDGNEASRNETFNTNESTRQENEYLRVEAEQQREEAVAKIESRQTSVETQFNAIQQEITDKDVISAPEIIAARGGEETLSDRLDKEHQDVTTQLAQTNTIQAESVINKPASKQLSIIKKREPLVLFTDDDGSPQIIPKLKPVSEETGVPFSIALIEKRLRDGAGITLKEAKDLQDELGWEVLSHGYDDTALGNEDLSEGELERQIRDSMKYLREKGFNVQNFVYPGGQASENAVRVVSKYANAVLGTGVAPNNYPLQMYNINRLAYPQPVPNNTFAFYKSKVDEAVANNRILVWMLHCGQPSLDDTQLSILVDLINYIKSIGVKMPTVQGAVDLVGNVIDINNREFYMSADGTNNIFNTVFKNASPSDASDLVSIEDAPDSFERNKVTVSIVNTTRNLSPSSLGGILITNALNNVTYTSQTFIDSQGNHYVRYALNASEWRGFKKTITSKQTLTYDFPTRTVKANTSFWQVIYDSSIRTSEVIVAQPVGVLEMGLSFNCWSQGQGQAVIEIHNGTNKDINMSARTFNVQRLET